MAAVYWHCRFCALCHLLGVMAQLSEGSMRDAISTLDRCLAFGKEQVTYQDVIDILGIAGIEVSCRMIQRVTPFLQTLVLAKCVDLH